MDADDAKTPADRARLLMASAKTATLATSRSGWPFASLVLTAFDPMGAPLLLLSDLAEHAKNIKAEPRVSLLFDGTTGLDDPLTGPRVTLMGEAKGVDREDLLARFIARHPTASAYAQFRDFRLYRVAPVRAHLVAGFGRIHWIEAAELLGSGRRL